jgi:hypothetical protein
MSQSFKSSSSTQESYILNFEPSYVITRRTDLTLQFHPSVGSRELADSLSIKYPNGDLTAKIRQASLDFLIEEIDSALALQAGENFERLLDDDLYLEHLATTELFDSAHEINGSSSAAFQQASQPLISTNSGPPIAIWDASTMQHTSEKRRKRRYDSKERQRVAENRRRRATCDQHKLRKSKVSV